jgi:flavin-dependent dehydrogenase
MEYQAIIIGAGPAGTSAAAILAEYGHRVLIIEREKFPRYHIGESLIPFTYAPLARLGMTERMKRTGFMKKYSVNFVQTDGKRSQPFYFFTRYDKETIAQTYQVVRSEFDQMMLENALEKGAEIRQQTSVISLLEEEGRVVGVRTKSVVTGEIHEVRADITLDCTGKEALTSNLKSWRMKDPFLNKIAVWTYYRGSKREPGIDEGGTTVAFVPEKGWFWHIPLHDDRVSVGVVAEAKYLTRDGVKDPQAIFEREVQQNAWIADHLSEGTCEGEYWVTSEYSRHSKYCASPGLLLVGDAFAFLDPVFSSGVLLALKTGVMAGDAVHEGLLAGDLSPARFEDYGATIRRSIENMRKLVYAFYQPDFSFKDVIQRFPECAGPITDCLSGDVGKDFGDLWDKIETFVPLPKDLPYGLPLAG